MALSEARKKANEKWNKANMTVLTCKVKKEYGDKVREHAASMGESVNGFIGRAIKETIDRDLKIENDTPDP